MKRHLRLGVLAAIAVTLGWGIGRGQAAEVVRLVALPAIAQTTTVTIEMGDYYFNPANPTLVAGSYTIVAVNMGEKRHNLIIDGNGVYKQSREVGSGGRDSFTIDLAPGTYRIYCDIGDHLERGMLGTLTVTAPAPAPAAAAPAPAEPPPAEAAPAGPPADAPPADAPSAEAPPSDQPLVSPLPGEAGSEGEHTHG
ncbi:MAG: cupredoxin domain-containing protein [Chloroflexi bacterium]|nr:cupredoxin domain-containing protein [Chloroflexota bacterium]